jgi:phosphopantetheinyl transferase
MEDFFYNQSIIDEALTLRCHMEAELCLVLIDISQGAAQLTENEALLLSWLSREEKEYCKKFRFPKRHHEWLSGRIAAKHCLLRHNQQVLLRHPPRDFSILPDSHGRPICFLPPGEKAANITISHSRGYAVAMTADQPCGVDIQHIGAQILKVRDRIATTDEIALAKQHVPGNPEAALTLLWSTKEAVKKHRLPEYPGLFEAISVQRISPEANNRTWTLECRLTTADKKQIVQAVHLEQYMLAWCRG